MALGSGAEERMRTDDHLFQPRRSRFNTCRRRCGVDVARIAHPAERLAAGSYPTYAAEAQTCGRLSIRNSSSRSSR